MFYRPGGTEGRISTQFDEVYADFVDGATAWLPISRGNQLGINIARASIEYINPASSIVTRSAVAPQATIRLELKTMGSGDAWPVEEWQNEVVADQVLAKRDGFARLRITNIDQIEGDGVSMAIQVARNTTGA